MLSCSIQLCNHLLIYATLLGSLLSSVVASQIPLGSRITVVENKPWVSSNGDFAINFFEHPVQSNQYNVGIRFNSNSIPVDDRQVVWVAGAEFTVGNDSSFHLTISGELQLIDSSSGNVVWTSKTANLGVSYSSLRDDGNLILLNNKKEIVWQSFNSPSDTLLPGQNFYAPQKLRASKKSSYSSFYSLFLGSGQLQLRWKSQKVYWKSRNPSLENLHAVLNTSGVLQLLDERSMSVWSVFADDHNDHVRFRFLRLDVDGNLRLYSWDDNMRSWRTVWQAVENQCDVFATCAGDGVCVFNQAGSAVCKCPFSLTTDAGSNCWTPYARSCDTSTTMATYEHTSLYGIYPPNDSLIITDLQQCKNSCLEDPLCTSVTFLNDGTARCLMKKTPYISGYSDPSLVSISCIKICSDPLAALPKISPPPSYLHSPSPSTSHLQGRYGLVTTCVLGAALGTFCVVAIVQLILGLWLHRRSASRGSNFRTAFPELNSSGFTAFTYAEIKEMTGNFMYQIRPNLFRGTLQHNQTVMIKQIQNCADEKKFRSRVTIIGNIYHKGLVKLEGYCFAQPDHAFLVYEFLKNDTLEKCLRDHKTCKRVLTWKKRLGICLSVGRAVSYLHSECREFISHGNLRCENVVLDDNLQAKVLEYGVREFLHQNEALSSAGGPAEQDVKDFGKFVLDLITGTCNTEESCEWLYEKWVQGEVASIVDQRIEGGVELEEVERMLRIAFWCLQHNEQLRPSMREVVKVLEGTLSVDSPPHPFMFRRHPDGDEASKLEMED